MAERNQAKAKAYQILYDYKLPSVTLDNLVYLLDMSGYQIVDYSRGCDDPSTQHLLDRYGLSTVAEQNSAFLYAQGDAKYIFLDDALPTDEKTYALAHEFAHICLGHVDCGTFLHGTFRQEHEANEFAHYLLSPAPSAKARVWVLGHKVIAAVALVAVLGGGVVYPVATYVDSRAYHGGYYVTPHGTHYHVEDCYYIQGHEYRELTAEELNEGKYLPCSVCIRE